MKTPPAVQPEKDWKEVELPFLIGSGRTLATGIHDRLRLKTFLRTSDNHLVGRIWFGEGAEGPPFHAHGGASAYILDEVMGACGWANMYPVVAAELKFQYSQMVPMFEDHVIDAWVEKASGKRVTIKSQLKLARDGSLAVEGTGEFHVLSKAKVEALMKSLPPQAAAQQAKIIQQAYKWAKDDAS
jgi:acyl-coenzyme A thioesterase PaaI-like protein